MAATSRAASLNAKRKSGYDSFPQLPAGSAWQGWPTTCPRCGRTPPAGAGGAGHGGGDFFEILDFKKLVRGEADAPFGIHEAMEMTLPGLISQQSIREGGRWLPVPNSRDW